MDNPYVDPEDAIETQIWEAVASTLEGREPIRTDRRDNWINVKPSATPFANLAWSQIRTEVALARIDGKDKGEAESMARQTLQNQATRSIINHVEEWNTLVNALSEQMVADVEQTGGSTTGDVFTGAGTTGQPGTRILDRQGQCQRQAPHP
jgi:hypothetical protein